MVQPIPLTDEQRHQLFNELLAYHDENDEVALEGDDTEQQVPVTNTAPTIDATHLVQEVKDALGGDDESV